MAPAGEDSPLHVHGRYLSALVCLHEKKIFPSRRGRRKEEGGEDINTRHRNKHDSADVSLQTFSLKHLQCELQRAAHDMNSTHVQIKTIKMYIIVFFF